MLKKEQVKKELPLNKQRELLATLCKEKDVDFVIANSKKKNVNKITEKIIYKYDRNRDDIIEISR